ncbi:BZ3500_MvSof-1268-A1-R1_Chr1-3g01961 [Microbotryum saponariae]|uniref:Thiamine pyrophosphokinase n=1 Tax=Microbotryum saponariae TaxID=289078 RepID=A0A2X0KQ66_9BASI|nr:BZ3500_MvSof-1268-A1-R1_Chr1-3g01961 [Microbotryum saponariae]SCZ95027.1 BZ3501_MvSof-1269-A2-R1_Chr1-3g01563 [Microbotryum saponariae]
MQKLDGHAMKSLKASPPSSLADPTPPPSIHFRGVKRWRTDTFLCRDDGARPNALIILNTPLVRDELFRKLWAAASVRYCADGGANRLYDAYRSKEPSQAARTNRDDPTTIHDDDDDMIPDLIKGDLDSLRDDVRAYYESKNVFIVHDPDQYSTDLGKCVVALTEYETKLATQATPSTSNEPAPPRTPIQHQLVIVGGLSGRLDQTIHTLHALTLLDQEREMTWAVGKESLACVLGQGTHDISTNLKYFGDTCGILPVGEPAKVTTSGLRWDLTPTTFAYPTSIAAGVSSSNHLPQETITVTTDVPVVWTVEVRSTTRP